jgi:hypothetical protein
MTAKLKVVAGTDVDVDAVAIGEFYKRAERSDSESLGYYWACGHALVLKKSQPEMSAHWLEWLKANRDALGFGERNAQLLIKFSTQNTKPASDISAEDADSLRDNLWGRKKKDSELVQQSLSNEHYTPEKYIEAARKVLGGIDLDPASCEEANEIIKAKRFFTEADDGLAQAWKGRVWLNPPYGDKVGKFVSKLRNEKGVTASITLVNAHCTDTIWFQLLWDGTLCFTDHRINFYGDDERSGSTHGSVFVYFGPDKDRFAKEFSQFGAVVRSVL